MTPRAGRPAASRANFDAATVRAARLVLAGDRRGLRAVLPFLGPAFIASVAYVDPGNFATNIQGGAQFGYLLLWVVVASNLMAMLIQTLSAKLGIATRMNLAELCREQFPRPIVWCLWVISELVGHGHRLAEVLGAAIGFQLLFGMPLLPAGLLTGGRHIRHPRTAALRVPTPRSDLIALMVGVIAACYVVETLLDAPDWGEVGRHAVRARVRRAGQHAAGRRHPGRDGHAARRSFCTRT